MADDCLFCKIAKKSIPSRAAFEDDAYYAFHDINPAAPTHVLIIPRRHIASLNDLQAGDESLVGGLFSIAKKLAADLGHAESGYRTVFNCGEGAGQSVWHIHLHLLAGRKLSWPPG